MSIIATIEDALMAEVAKALAKKVTVESLSGPWTMAALKRSLQFSPCVRVAFLGGSASSAYDTAINAAFGVYFVVSHASDTQRRRGSARAVGLYDMLELTVPALNELTMDGGTLFLKSVRQEFAEQTLALGGAVYAAMFEMPNLILPPLDPTATMADFVTFHADSSIDGDATPEITTQEILPT